MWAVTRYGDIKAVLRDSDTFSAANTVSPVFPMDADAARILRDRVRLLPILADGDASSHPRIRRGLLASFSRRVAELEPFIEEQAARLVDGIADSGCFDIIHELCFPLPESTLFRLLGVPLGDATTVRSWCEGRLVVTWGDPPRAAQIASAHRTVALWRYLEELVEARQHQPQDDLISDLLARQRDEPDLLTPQEIASVAFLLMFAGHDTTTGLLTNCVRQLLSAPQRWTALCRDSSRIPDVVEETLRYDPPLIAWRRVTTRPSVIGEVPVPERATLLLLLGAANRDPETFASPEAFSPNRPRTPRHLAFGWGPHHCAGAAIARLQARVVLELLTNRFPELRLIADQTLDFPPNVSFRRPLQLWVGAQPATGR
jgi:hypothetical protein